MKNTFYNLNRKLWLTIALVLSVALPGFAQKITVHGYVDDEHGEPLIGATVMEKAPQTVQPQTSTVTLPLT